MLGYKTQYHILASIYYRFSNLGNNKNSNSLSVSHSDKKIENMKRFYKPEKYHTSSKENFIIYCLYTVVFNNITSLHEMMEKLVSYTDEDIKKINEFKKSIINYRRNLVYDVQTITERYGKESTPDDIIKLYMENKIQWYTMYFFCKFSNVLEKMKKTRRYGKIFKKLEVLLSYIKLNNDTINIIKECIKD